MEVQVKKICFESNDKMHADLKIKLHYDDLKIKEFFNQIVQAYINEDPHIISFIDKLKEEKNISKRKKMLTKKMRNNQKEVKEKFALDSSEIESIFDILEKEHPEL